jgi:glycosyltransferase involved in cell wall biosynthesis
VNVSDGFGKLESMLDFTIIVCTKDRPLQIESVMKQVRKQICSELKSFIVVDGSDSEETESIVRLLQETWLDGTKLEYIRTQGGKPTALNLGLEHVNSETEKPFALLFFDDDVHFCLQDFVKGMIFLYEHDFCGLSPLIINEGETSSRHRKKSIPRFFRNRQGDMTKAGENIWIDANYFNEIPWVPTSWLPGGAVMYIFEKVSDLQFRQDLENPVLRGYALGDDVDFSMRASKRGQIGCLRSIQVIHSPTPDSVRQPLKIAIAEGRWKAYLVNEFPEKVFITRVISTQFLKTVWRFLRRNRSREPFFELRSFLVSFFLNTSNSQNFIIRNLHKRALNYGKGNK